MKKFDPVDSSATVVYIPLWQGNKDLPEDEQVKVELQPPCEGDFAEQYRRVDGGVETDFPATYARMFGNRVKSITNLELSDGTKIDSGAAWSTHQRKLPFQYRSLHNELLQQLFALAKIGEAEGKN